MFLQILKFLKFVENFFTKLFFFQNTVTFVIYSKCSTLSLKNLKINKRFLISQIFS